MSIGLAMIRFNSKQTMRALGDEIEKTAKYPISRLLTGRKPAAAAGGLQGFLIAGPAGAAVDAGGGLINQQIVRTIGGRALQGRIARGGKGLLRHEKKKMAEALGISVAKLEKAIAKQGGKGGKTYPLSRAVSSKNLGLPVIRRMVDTRALSGRVQRGGKGLTKREKSVMDALGQGRVPRLPWAKK